MRSRKVAEAVREAAATLERAGVPDARRDAERLLGHVLDVDRGGLVARRPDAVAPDVVARFEELIRRRAGREPLQHLTGAQEFYGLELRVDRRALIPRPETEGLVDAVLQANLRQDATVLDLGTGSGCIAIALAVTRNDLRIVAIDSRPEVLELARENLARFDLADRIDLRQGDESALRDRWAGRLDAVVCNPPYVPEAEWSGLEPEVRDHEPRAALVPGPTGLEAYERVLPACFELVAPGGLLALEIGFGQADAVHKLCGDAGFVAIAVRPDLRGIDRVVVARRPEQSC